MDEKADPMLGRVLDRRYRIEQRIARGGMAMVYVATDLRLQRTVAVKVMHESLAADPTFVARFEREAHSAAKISHPNAVAVFDQGEDGDTLFLVMEYIPGVTLRDLIRREAPLPPAMALRLMESVLDAIGAAHALGIVHRDIKPENVLLPTANPAYLNPRDAQVADFGLARAINTESQHTATGGVVIGTVSYLAPEMLVDARADERVDVYAAGVLIYELLTGQKPHQADNPIQVAYKHVHEDIPKPSTLVPAIPPYLDALVALATARDAHQRPADATVLLRHVERVRYALEAGVIDDPDLTADLTPRPTASPSGASEDPEDTAADGIIPWDPALEADFEPTAQLAPQIVPPLTNAESVRPVARPRRRRRWRLYGALLLLSVIVACAVAGSWYWFVFRYTTAPNVLNKAESVAMATLRQSDLAPKVSQRFSETVPSGSVVSETPAPGDRLLKNSTVTLVVSLGKPAVPRLVGLSQAAATSLLTSVGLSVGTVNQAYSDTVAVGVVLSSDPGTGTAINVDGAGVPTQSVSLTVSEGPAPVTIPNFVWQSTQSPGETLAQATKDLQALGLKVVTDTAQSSWTVPAGSIISQSPAGTTGHRGDTVTLTGSSGLPTFTVPDLRGKSWSDAVAALSAACSPPAGGACFPASAGNAKATLAEEVWTVYGANIGSVKKTSPAAGTVVPAGTTVSILY